MSEDWVPGDKFQLAADKNALPEPHGRVRTVESLEDGFRNIIITNTGERFYADHCHKVVASGAIEAARAGLQKIEKELTPVTWEYRIWAAQDDIERFEGDADRRFIWRWEARASDGSWTEACDGDAAPKRMIEKQARAACAEQRRLHQAATAHEEAEWIEYEP